MSYLKEKLMAKVIDKSEAVAKAKSKIKKKIKIEKYVINNNVKLTVLYSDWCIQQYDFNYMPKDEDIDKIKTECADIIYKVNNSAIGKFPTATIK
jgi:hypothetical protein